ncbi:anthranilate phosphoribosyltransferase, partial [bacterium]|nr:anthranilate phosphoribosyltransferase [bacterium]
ALTAAAAGVRIAKHGNYGVSSQCGSSNVLEALGLKFPTTQSEVEASLDKAGIAFLHAPYFHPAMKAFAPLRKGLGMKTFFNTLGPIVNPARPQTKLLGVNSLALLRLYGFLHEGDQDQNEHSNFAIVHSLDGYDEISLTSPVRIITKAKDCILEPEDFLATRIKPEELVAGESIAANVSAFKRIISGQACLAEISVISANAGMLISLAQKVDLPTGILRAREALLSGKAQNILEKLIG